MEFGLMFFASLQPETASGGYRLLTEAARLADAHGLCAVWTPERHFHRFGGLFPNPAVTGAALATLTERISIRAGSLVSPLHDTLRIAEEWAVVDNLSEGRAEISFGSGWNIEDFVLQPDRYTDRHAVMYRQIEEVQRLWRGESILRRDSNGREVAVAAYPRPLRGEIPIWVTSSGNAQTFVSAGEIGASVLTHLIGQDISTLADKIDRYRQARASKGFDPRTGRVALMLHTFIGDDLAAVRERVRQPMREYLRSAVSLEQMAAQAGGSISGGLQVAPHGIPASVMEELLDLTFERYFRSSSLLGTLESCAEIVLQLEEVGVDEIACLIDFIAEPAAVLGSLERLAALVERFSRGGMAASKSAQLDEFLAEIDG